MRSAGHQTGSLLGARAPLPASSPGGAALARGGSRSAGHQTGSESCDLSVIELTLLIAEVEAQMLKLAELLEFEKVALLRDQLKSLGTRLTRRLKADGVGTRGKVG